MDQTTPALQHLAVIMDGNGRWAKQRFLPRQMGHRAGAKAVRSLLKLCLQYHIPILTLFAFSSENWGRPPEEVENLLTILMENLQQELPLLKENQISLQIIGERERFSSEIQEKISHVESETAHYEALKLFLALSYGGRWDITQAAQKIAHKVQLGDLKPEEITEEVLSGLLSMGHLPDPDLLIRTSGEHRISNFLLWQCAYTEFYFTDTLWPDFDETEFLKAMGSYANRQRRFGGIHKIGYTKN